ncbi:toll/interleukin-1 receptor domain-containing protein [Luteolibacter luteus]|uniref:Toll/interleukin-1 receptor domain-containing protein n=1 Tax=Luteolibacter luteus TaxID=2728835 RepID=A0A858RMW4_9BACT|nr:toll/interleukin-1 receptor domain-containing protein [Luteolibacter luteus]QJE98192.1 toll/interleukin-1 receptor domain-containing protein [Luteolibacter luteus]
MGQIFISYSHADQEFVSLLARGLKIAGYNLWRDIDRMSGGQSISREVEVGIDTSSVFLTVVTENFDKSKWLRNELARAVGAGVSVVPVVFSGAKVPIQLEDPLRIVVRESGPNWSADEILRVVEEIQRAAGRVEEDDFDDFDDSDSSDDWDENDDFASRLTNTRWSWCENPDARDDAGMWIEFLPGGELRKSWRPERGKWAVTGNGLVLYKGHVLIFDLPQRRFRGALASIEKPNAERTGRLMAGGLD